MAMGILGYMRIEGWSFLDAAYMTIVTFTTVGYEEVHPLSSTGRVFTMFMMVVGVGVMLYILTSVVQIVVEEEILRTLFRRRRMRTQMAKLRNHFIVCGFGRVGREVALTLQQESAPLVVMDRNSEVLAEAEELGLLGVEGDPTKDEDLLSVHVGEAYCLVAATGSDADNVYIALTARGLNPSLRIVARASRADAEDKLHRAGADMVISPYSIGGRQMAQSAIELMTEAWGRKGGLPNGGSARLDAMKGQGLGFQRVQIQATGCLVDVEANHLAISIYIDVQPLSDLDRIRPRLGVELDIEAVGLRIVMEFHS